MDLSLLGLFIILNLTIVLGTSTNNDDESISDSQLLITVTNITNSKILNYFFKS
jgi:hypothetical protein